MLIVCEGAKTEPHYLWALVDYLKLSSANVEIDDNSGSSPISVVRHAKRRYREERGKGDAFDRVYCVFDKDTHATYYEAINACVSFKPLGVLHAVPSVPCFEYWLLLHFTCSTSPYNATSGKSACDHVIAALRNYLPSYSKGNAGIFNKIMEQMNQAITFSKQVIRATERAGTDNPITRMHELVEYLIQLKK